MIDFTVLTDKLSTLDSADEVASFLGSQGICALQANARSCAISQFVSRESGETVATSPGFISLLGEEMEHGKQIKQTVELSTACREFVGRFDAGFYPELVSENYHDHREYYVMRDGSELQ